MGSLHINYIHEHGSLSTNFHCGKIELLNNRQKKNFLCLYLKILLLSKSSYYGSFVTSRAKALLTRLNNSLTCLLVAPTEK